MTTVPPDLRIAPKRLHFAGIVAGAIVLVPLVGIATIGHGFDDPPIMILLIVVWLVGTVGIEVKARTAYVSVGEGQLGWRVYKGWRAESRPTTSVSRVAVTPQGDLEIAFSDGRQPLRLLAKEFRREDLDRLAKALSPRRDLPNP